MTVSGQKSLLLFEGTESLFIFLYPSKLFSKFFHCRPIQGTKNLSAEFSLPLFGNWASLKTHSLYSRIRVCQKHFSVFFDSFFRRSQRCYRKNAITLPAESWSSKVFFHPVTSPSQKTWFHWRFCMKVFWILCATEKFSFQNIVQNLPCLII